MDDEKDETAKPHASSRENVEKLRRLLTQFARAKWHTAGSLQRVSQVTSLLDFFQEDPQVLDPHLATLLPSLVSAFLDVVKSGAFKAGVNSAVARANDAAIVIFTFCKVRGRKVIARFLDNEPRYLDTLLSTYHLVQSFQSPTAPQGVTDVNVIGAVSESGPLLVSWELEYVVLLWLSHLVLTPFDLSTLSGQGPFNGELQGVQVPENAPLVTKLLLKIGLESLSSPTGQRIVAVDLLVRLSFRPDMRKLGLLECIITHTLFVLDTRVDATFSIHKMIGLLSLVSGIVAAGSLQGIGLSVVEIYDSTVKLFGEGSPANNAVQNSAVAKCLAIKIRRNILVRLLTHNEVAGDTCTAAVQQMLESRTALLEDVIDFLIQSLADRDTQVRLAASKAISVIAQKLDQEMADEIVEAIIGSLEEDVLVTDGAKSYAAVNALRWHGLTMTLSHMLFRRIPSSAKILQILNAMYMALTFEQRSSSGHSVGGNVRDAANFGLWSLARRYVTGELAEYGSHDTLQRTARHLVCAACFDPVGNVRRGSSAALQELVGRHPDTVEQGIALIQIVDYQAVGLRSRAMGSVARQAASVAPQYRIALRQAVYDWRGLLAVDQQSREVAAAALYHFVDPTVEDAEYCIGRLEALPLRDAEGRHGLIAGLASISRKAEVRWQHECSVSATVASTTQVNAMLRIHKLLNGLWLRLHANIVQLRPRSRRPDLVGRSILMLTQDFLLFTSQLHGTDRPNDNTYSEQNATSITPYQKLSELFTAAIQIVGEDSLEMVQGVTDVVSKHYMVFNKHSLGDFAQGWLEILRRCSNIVRIPGIQIALGTVVQHIEPGIGRASQVASSIVQKLLDNSHPSVAMEARVIAIRSLGIYLSNSCSEEIFDIVSVLNQSLNDYTVTERGDEGSLVRVEALRVLRKCWSMIRPLKNTNGPAYECYMSTLTLALGKLDKVRVEAVLTLQVIAEYHGWHYPRDRIIDAITVSDTEHFLTMAQLLNLQKPQSYASEESTSRTFLAVLEGFAISAGSGTSTTLPAAREALAATLDDMAAYPPEADTVGVCAVVDVANGLNTLLQTHQDNDRILIPLLETIAFLLDFGIIQQLCQVPSTVAAPFKFRNFLSLIQKAHFKSTSMPKLLAAVSVYSGLAEVPGIRSEVLAKLISMLVHPFPSVRVEAAKALWLATNDAELKPKVWTQAPARHKDLVEQLKSRYCQV